MTQIPKPIPAINVVKTSSRNAGRVKVIIQLTWKFNINV